jgi:hypothetical protein
MQKTRQEQYDQGIIHKRSKQEIEADDLLLKREISINPLFNANTKYSTELLNRAQFIEEYPKLQSELEYLDESDGKFVSNKQPRLNFIHRGVLSIKGVDDREQKHCIIKSNNSIRTRTYRARKRLYDKERERLFNEQSEDIKSLRETIQLQKDHIRRRDEWLDRLQTKEINEIKEKEYLDKSIQTNDDGRLEEYFDDILFKNVDITNSFISCDF